MAGHRQGLRRCYFSSTSEGTYGTAEAITHYANLQSSLAPVAHEWYSDTEEATGKEEETAADLLAKSARFTLSGRASDKILPILMSFALGGDTMTQSGGAAEYMHLIEPAAVGTELVAFTHEQHAAGASDATAGSSRKYTGCVVDTFRLSGSRKGWVMFSADIIGRGDQAGGGAQTEASLAGPTIHYPVGSCDAWVSTGGLEGSFSVTLPTIASTNTTDLNSSGLTNLKNLMRDFEFTLANNIQVDDGYILDSGTVMGVTAPRGARVQTLTFTLDYTSSTAAFVAWAEANTTTPAFELSCTTGTQIVDTHYHAFKLFIPQMQVKEITPGEANGQQTLAFSCQAQDDGTNSTSDFYNWNAENIDYGST